MPHIQCEKKMITSHYPYLENPEPSCVFLYDFLKNSQSHIVSLSDRIKTEFIRRGIDGTNVSVLPCGIDTQSYALDVDDVLFPDKSIVVGKIEPRKRQTHLQKQNLKLILSVMFLINLLILLILLILVSRVSKTSWTISQHMLTWYC